VLFVSESTTFLAKPASFWAPAFIKDAPPGEGLGYSLGLLLSISPMLLEFDKSTAFVSFGGLVLFACWTVPAIFDRSTWNLRVYLWAYLPSGFAADIAL